MSRKLKLYHRLPYPMRALAATLYGYSLHRWRYSRETDRFIERALERESWSNKEWQAWQEERLAYILHRAATKVPFYQELWAARRRNGDRVSWEVLGNWPILKKESLRLHGQAFVADDCDIHKMYIDSTSGTTGKPVRIWLSRETTQQWYALWDARTRSWNGVSRNDRWAMLGGQLVVPFSQTQPPYWVWNGALDQLYLSAYHIGPDYVPDYLEAIRKHRIKYMLGLASSMHALAHIALEKGLETPEIQVAISNGEPLYPHRREAISKAFGCPVRDTYGMVEIVAAASECQEGSMHFWPEAGFVEVLQDEGSIPVQIGQTGRFICTGLMNADMPLIRYEVGDRGSIAAIEGRCGCERSLPLMKNLDGRHDDVVMTRDGRWVGCVDAVLKADLPIQEAQIIQESLENIRIRFIPATGFGREHEISIVEGVCERLGDVNVILDPVSSIPRSANAKSRVIISLLKNSQPNSS